MTEPAEIDIPLSQYHAEVVSGERDPGETGLMTRDEFVAVFRQCNFTEETIRCGECFEPENLNCPGMLWLGNIMLEQTGDTCLELVCPLDVQSAKNAGEVVRPGISYNLTKFSQGNADDNI